MEFNIVDIIHRQIKKAAFGQIICSDADTYMQQSIPLFSYMKCYHWAIVHYQLFDR
jgi:hypothetical protein